MTALRSSRQPRGTDAALLRAPPFPGAPRTLSEAARAPVAPPPADGTIDAVFAAIRDARVGGTFWAPAAALPTGGLIVRVRSPEDLLAVRAGLSDAERSVCQWLLPAACARHRKVRGWVAPEPVLFGEVDPWSLLPAAMQVLAHGDDEWAVLGHIAGCTVRLLSDGCFGAADAHPAALREHAVTAVFGERYCDPFTRDTADVTSTIELLAFWRRTIEANRGIVAASGIAWWKRHEIARFLWSADQPLRFFRSERRALAHAARHNGAVAVWPSRISPAMVDSAATLGVPLIRVEDGFVRSVGLGSDMVPPSSVTVDRLGIHYDPSRASDLEALLAATAFPPTLLGRAERLRTRIVTAGISKYGGNDAQPVPARQPGRRLVLVPGQVEDDMSVRLGGGGLASNLELLRRARVLEPDAEIWFRPHPDVDAGHRKGAVRDADAMRYADRIVRGGGMAALLDVVDSVHVLTSLTGFEALLRGRTVTCHGMPFYAGWGLTHDVTEAPARRGRSLTLAELVAGVLILYPRYLDPMTGIPCAPEVLLDRMVAGDAVNRLGWVSRIRRLQGRLSKAGHTARPSAQ